jgi:hypothetical protein
MVKLIVSVSLFSFLSQLSLTHLLQSAFLCLSNTPWAPPWSWPFAWSITFSFFRFLVLRALYNLAILVNRNFHNPASCVSRIFHNPAFRVGRILSKPHFHVSNMTGTSFFMLRVANPAKSVNPANLICLSIHAAVWPNPIACRSVLLFWLTQLTRLR